MVGMRSVGTTDEKHWPASGFCRVHRAGPWNLFVGHVRDSHGANLDHFNIMDRLHPFIIILCEPLHETDGPDSDFRIENSHHCNCPMTNPMHGPRLFVMRTTLEFASHLESKGYSGGVKMLHYGGPNNNQHHTRIIGPLPPSAKEDVEAYLAGIPGASDFIAISFVPEE